MRRSVTDTRALSIPYLNRAKSSASQGASRGSPANESPVIYRIFEQLLSGYWMVTPRRGFITAISFVAAVPRQFMQHRYKGTNQAGQGGLISRLPGPFLGEG
jgi:hypothetical protein